MFTRQQSNTTVQKSILSSLCLQIQYANIGIKINLIVIFNAKIGNRKDEEELILSPYCSGKKTRNVEKLIEFLN